MSTTIAVVPLNIQSGWSDRGAYQAGLHLDEWRLNLVQLSADFNLIFIASCARILVGEPTFPSQTLPGDFPLVIDTPPSAPNLAGYINPANPHTINNLLVDRLGSEEIVVAVRDDGDVDAYLVRHIFEAIQQSKEGFSRTSGLSAADIRPLLHRNVGKSAWGVAVHTEARMIAVSSNNHEFNIFSFALVDKKDGVNDSASIAHNRNEDSHITVPNGLANIPCVSFCNTGDDPEGRWLLTADVSGLVRSWDLHARSGTHSFHIGPSPRVSHEYNREASGWVVAFLDSRSFAAVEKFEDRVSRCIGAFCSVLNQQLPVWDMTAEKVHVIWQQEDENLVMDSVSASADDIPQPHQFVNADFTRDVAQLRCLQHENTYHCLLEAVGPIRPLHEIIIGFMSGTAETAAAAAADDHDYGDDDDDDDDNDDEGEEEEEANAALELRGFINRRNLPPGSYMHTTVAEAHTPGRRRFWMIFGDDGATCPNIPCPIFYSSVREMYMLQPPSRSAPRAEDHFPVVLLGDHWDVCSPWGQNITSRTPWLQDPSLIERGCMFAQIPSLGVVVVGNQTGRVVVMSGFKTQQHVDIAVRSTARIRTYKWVYGLRLEAMLPYASEEAAEYRPHCMLYGMAVAPMQGTQHLPDDEKRWRLIFMYVDDTVFSYEIKRKPDRCGVAISDIII